MCEICAKYELQKGNIQSAALDTLKAFTTYKQIDDPRIMITGFAFLLIKAFTTKKLEFKNLPNITNFKLLNNTEKKDLKGFLGNIKAYFRKPLASTELSIKINELIYTEFELFKEDLIKESISLLQQKIVKKYLRYLRYEIGSQIIKINYISNQLGISPHIVENILTLLLNKESLSVYIYIYIIYIYREK